MIDAVALKLGIHPRINVKCDNCMYVEAVWLSDVFGLYNKVCPQCGEAVPIGDHEIRVLIVILIIGLASYFYGLANPGAERAHIRIDSEDFLKGGDA